MTKPLPESFFVFDVESVGLHGEGFAVGGGVYLENGAAQWEFMFVCNPAHAMSDGAESEKWVSENIPVFIETHRDPLGVRSAFWEKWMEAKNRGSKMVTDCGWPVEARFLLACVNDNKGRLWTGPYPLLDLSSMLLAAGLDPVGKFPRTPSEIPEHNPLCDARQSARVLAETLKKLRLC